jgi:class 3 adenylate cyclase
VNTASRLQAQSLPGCIQVSESTYARLCDRYRFEPRGEIELKGKGPTAAYFLLGRDGG